MSRTGYCCLTFVGPGRRLGPFGNLYAGNIDTVEGDVSFSQDFYERSAMERADILNDVIGLLLREYGDTLDAFAVEGDSMSIRPKPFNEDAAPSSDPFAGDFGEGERIIYNTIVDAPTYNFCAGTIKAGTRCRCQIETRSDIECANDASDLEAEIHYWCEACCKALAKDDDGEAIERRVEIGNRKRAALWRCVRSGES